MKTLRYITAAALLVLAGCSSIKIESGSTPEERGATYELQAREIRLSWVDGFSKTTEIGKAIMLKDQIDSSSERLYGLAGQFAREWQRGNEGRGQAIPADDMQQVFENTIAPQKSILKAWQDNMEYGWEWVTDSSRLSQPVRDLLGQMIDEYYEAYSGVFFPESTVDAYEDRNAESQTRMRNLSDRLTSELRSYR